MQTEKIVFYIVIIFILISGCIHQKQISEKLYISQIPQLSLDDYLQANVSVGINELTFNSNCYQLSMVISDEQAFSIKIAINNLTTMRPNAHDLFASMLKNFNMELLMIKITSIKDNTYFANIIIKNQNKILSLDSRPSDAVAIALRYGAPIYINKNLLNENGKRIC